MADITRQYVTRGLCISDKHVLLLQKKGEAHYFLPGGRVEVGEGYEYALKREIEEELDKTCVINSLIGVIEHEFVHYSGKDYYEVGLFFDITIDGLSAGDVNSNEEELEFHWHPIDQLEDINIKPRPVIDLVRQLAKGDTSCFFASTVSKR